MTRVPEQYAKAGKIVREMREWIVENVSVPQTYLEIDMMVEDEIAKRGGQPAFPTGIGVNAVTAHYAPQDGDQTKTLQANPLDPSLDIQNLDLEIVNFGPPLIDGEPSSCLLFDRSD